MNKSRLKDLMHEHNMKAADLARLSGVSEGSISQYLSGRCNPSHKTAMKLAKALNVDVHEIYEPFVISVGKPSVNTLFAGVGRINVDTSKFIDDNRIITIEDLYYELSEENKQKFFESAMLILKGLQ